MTGSSSISIPRTNDPRALQGAFVQISTRLSALEKALGVTSAQAGQNNFNATQSNASITDLARRIAAIESSRANTASEVVLRSDSGNALYDVVYATSSNGCSTADPDSIPTSRDIIGVAENAAAVNAPVGVRRFGNMTITGATFTPGEIVYWGSAGFTHDPTGAAVAIPVGIATGLAAMFVLLETPALLERGAYTELAAFMPVAFALVQFAVELVDTLAGQPDGLVVLKGGELQTRAVIASSGGGISVMNGDGVDGDIHLSVP